MAASALLEEITVYDGTRDVGLVVSEASEASYRMESNNIDTNLPAVVSVWTKGSSTVPVIISAFGEVFTQTITTNWQRLEMKVENPLFETDDDGTTHFYIYISPLTDSTFYLYRGMVESNANHASDWIPAIEDGEESLDEDLRRRDDRLDALDESTNSAIQILKRVISGGYDATYTSASLEIGYNGGPISHGNGYFQIPIDSYMEAGCVYTLSSGTAVYTPPSGSTSPIGFTFECVQFTPVENTNPVEYDEEVVIEETFTFSDTYQKYTFVTPDDGAQYAIRLYCGMKNALVENAYLVLTEFILEQGTYASMWNDAIEQTRAKLEEVTSSLTESAGILNFMTSIRTSINDTVNLVTNSFEFDAITTPSNPKLIIRTSNDKMRMELSNNKLSFVMGTTEVAYFSSNRLYVKQLEGSESLSIGTASNGYLDLVTTSTGVGFVWR